MRNEMIKENELDLDIAIEILEEEELTVGKNFHAFRFDIED